MLLEKLARSVSEVDNYAREALVKEIQAMQHWVELAGNDTTLNLLAWLRSLPQQVRVMGNGPRAGCLHVAHVQAGGHSGRRHTFVVGLNDSRFPGSSGQDPLLLDRERESLSHELPKSSDELEKSLSTFVRAVSRLSGKVTLSYPCWDLVNHRELFPSSVILSAFRIVSGERDADQHDLDKALPTPASFVSANPDRVLEESEWWLSQLCGAQPVQEPLQAVGQRFPHLARGSLALSARQSNAFTPFDGCVPEAGRDFQPTTTAHVFSASGLETVGQCPLKYFFQHPLHVRPLAELVLDPKRWLDAMHFGRLLHAVFRQFMTELQQRDEIPEFTRHEKDLSEILRSHIQESRDMIPPPNEAAFRKQCRELNWAAKVFLKIESDYCQHFRPTYFEAAIGLRVRARKRSWTKRSPSRSDCPAADL